MRTPFPREALAAAAYRFEQANGNRIQLAEFDEIMRHQLTRTDPDELAQAIHKTVTSGEADADYRASACFALGKKMDDELLAFFRGRLELEVEAEELPVIYQIMIALDNLDEEIFAPERDGASSSNEHDLNLRDARAYLERLE